MNINKVTAFLTMLGATLAVVMPEVKRALDASDRKVGFAMAVGIVVVAFCERLLVKAPAVEAPKD